MTVAGFSFVKSLGGIEEYTLDRNGLTVLIAADHTTPVVTFQVTYRVGSRNEVTGTTGATHLLEHLMFKGSDAFNDPKGNSIKQFLERVGGQFNATTDVDRTNYFATVGRDDLEGYVAIEADRMRHLWLHESDRQAEMTVVRNEYERGKNDPNSVLMEEVTAAAYVALPYHHPTIGWKSDIEHVPIEKLREFYDTFYWPNNATVTVVGDVDTASALALVAKYYGAYPASPAPIPDIYTEEPAQTGARRVIVNRPGELGTVVIAHKVANGRDPDGAALDDARFHPELGQELAALPGARRSGSCAAGRFLDRPAPRPVAAFRLCGDGARSDARPGGTGAEARDRQDQERRRDGAGGRARETAISRRGRLQARRHGRHRERAQRVDRGRRLDAVREVSAGGRAGDARPGAARRAQISERGSEHHGLVRADARTARRRDHDDARSRPPRPFPEGLAFGMRAWWRPSGALAGAPSLAEHGRRSTVDGIDLVTYQTGVKEVVVIAGSLPAGDALAGADNIAVPTLTGMMLDRGTRARSTNSRSPTGSRASGRKSRSRWERKRLESAPSA